MTYRTGDSPNLEASDPGPEVKDYASALNVLEQWGDMSDVWDDPQDVKALDKAKDSLRDCLDMGLTGNEKWGPYEAKGRKVDVLRIKDMSVCLKPGEDGRELVDRIQKLVEAFSEEGQWAFKWDVD